MSEALAQVMDRMGGSSQKLLTIVVGVAALAVVWGFAQWGMAPTYVPVASGLPIDRVGEAAARLEEEGIPYRLDGGGSVITVEEASAPRARVVLAAEGLGGAMARPGFELFDQPSWGMTDFTQRVNYRRALEGELERTIGRMRGVGGAQVHLALQEGSFLKSANKPSEASVVLEVGAGGLTDESVVEGVQFLVASAVEGLSPENVMVLDDRGRLLSSPDDNGGIGLSARQLQVQRQIESHLQAKAEALVEQMVGPGNATVRVSAALNFDQIDRTVQALDPDQQALVSEEKSEITPGTTDQGAGSTTSNSVFETTRSVETLSRGGARLERLTVAVVLSDRRVEAVDGTVTSERRAPAETRQVEAVVRNAVGFSETRGDEISVVSVPPETPPMEEPVEETASAVEMAMAFQRPIVALAGLTVALFLGLRLLGSLRPVVVTAGGGRARPDGLSKPEDTAHMPAQAAAIAPPAPPPAHRVTDPNMTARVVRAWMKE